MQRSAGYPPIDPSEMDVNPTLNVVIAYEDFESGKQAKGTYDFLVENLGHECHFTSQMWKFDVLSISKLREMAVKDALSADIIVVACRGNDLPAPVKAWIELWLKDKGKPLALVALFHNPQEDLYKTREIRDYLHDVARRGDMEFFVQPDELAESPGRSESVRVPGALGDFSIAGLVDRQNSIPHWGINE